MIDLCVALNGPHVGVMLPFFLHTLRNIGGANGEYNLHLVFREQYAGGVYGYSAAYGRIYEHFEKFKDTNVSDRAPFDHTATDCAGICQWMLDNCGTEEWCFISHFDIDFRQPLLRRYIDASGPLDQGMGQVGAHATGLVGYRRLAVKQCSVGFNAVSGFVLTTDHRNVHVVRHGTDSRCRENPTPIHGFDVGELLELNIAGKGWGIYSPPDYELNEWRIHLGTGSGHCGDYNLKRNEALGHLARYDLQPLE